MYLFLGIALISVIYVIADSIADLNIALHPDKYKPASMNNSNIQSDTNQMNVNKDTSNEYDDRYYSYSDNAYYNLNEELNYNESELKLDIDFINSDLNVNENFELDYSISEKVLDNYLSSFMEDYSINGVGTCIINGNVCQVLTVITPTKPGGIYIIDISNGESNAKIYDGGPGYHIERDFITRVR